MKKSIIITVLTMVVLCISVFAEGVFYYKCEECNRGIFDHTHSKDHAMYCSDYPDSKIKINFSPKTKKELVKSIEDIVKYKNDPIHYSESDKNFRNWPYDITDDEAVDLILKTVKNYKKSQQNEH